MEYFSEFKLDIKSIKLVKYISEGGFGKVYRGQVDSKGQTQEVAVKIFLPKDGANILSFSTEIMALSHYRHQNLISLIGFCENGDEKIIVYEYASNKSLDFHVCDPNLTWTQRLKICLGAARGLEYLHDPKGGPSRMVHRDIKSANILIDENWNAKIADFGFAKLLPANQEKTFAFSDAKGTLGYCDPAYVETACLTKESDVYSFGAVLFEVLCCRPCVIGKLDDNDVRKSLPRLVAKCRKENTLETIIDPKLMEQMDHYSRDMFVTLACQCLEAKREHRPSMSSVVEKLQTALWYQEVYEGKVLEPDTSLRARKLREIYNPLLDFEKICPPGGINSIILYTTRVKTIRKEYQDSFNIRGLLTTLRVSFEERNVSMHWEFKDELLRALGKRVTLPRLFIKGRYVGGADDVLQLHEKRKFRPLLTEIPQITSE